MRFFNPAVLLLGLGMSSQVHADYYVAPGAQYTNILNAGEAQEADTSERHEVRCCADDITGIINAGTSSGGWKQNSECRDAGFTTWGESDPANECNESKTYAEALGICSGIGARLCTKEELLNDCTKGNFLSFFIMLLVLVEYSFLVFVLTLDEYMYL